MNKTELKKLLAAGEWNDVEFKEAQEAQVEAQAAQVELAKWQLSILAACATGEQTGKQLLEAAGYKTRTGNFKKGLQRLVEQQLIEYTIPDRPNSRLQKYRLTEKGRQTLAANPPTGNRGGNP